MKVYIAAPLNTGGDVAGNVRRAIAAFHDLLDAGHQPFCPHLFYFANVERERPEEDWLKLDQTWLQQCDAVIRLPGASDGADLEEGWAASSDIPVFTSVCAFVKWYGPP